MKYLKQFGIILGVSFIGELLNTLIPLPIPASIYGLVLIFIGLQTGIVRLSMVRETGKFLIEIMPLMFIPAAVGLMDSWKVLQPMIVPISVITVISTIVVMGVTGKVTQAVIRHGNKKTDQKGGVMENE